MSRIWTRQPQHAVTLDERNPLTRGLALWAPLHPHWGMVDLVTGLALGRSGLASSLVTKNGQVTPSFSSGSSATFPVPPGVTGSTPCAITWLQQPGTQSSAYPNIFVLKVSGSDYCTALESPSDSSYAFVVGRKGSTSISFSSQVGLLQAGRVDRYLLTAAGGLASGTASDWVLWRNGERLTTSSTIPTAADSGSDGRLGDSLAGGYPYVGAIADFGIWARIPSNSEIRAFFRNPHQVYGRRRAVVFVEAAGGGSINLTIADALHDHAADAAALTSQHALVIAEAAHSHSAESPAVSSATALSVADALHDHAADAATLSTASVLSVAEATHGHTADGLTLEASGSTTLVAADALHGHLADAIALTSSHALTVADAAHAHAADGLTLGAQTLLTIQDALHAHAADNLTLSTAPVLQIAEALHAQTADGVTITVDAWLVVADALHGHAADAVVLTVPSGTASAAEVWSYILSNGLTAEANVVGIYSMLQTLTGQAPCPTADQIATAVWAKELPL